MASGFVLHRLQRNKKWKMKNVTKQHLNKKLKNESSWSPKVIFSEKMEYTLRFWSKINKDEVLIAIRSFQEFFELIKAHMGI